MFAPHARDARENWPTCEPWWSMNGTSCSNQAGCASGIGAGATATLEPASADLGTFGDLGNLDEARDVLLGTSDPARGGLVRGDMSREYRIETVIPSRWSGFRGRATLDSSSCRAWSSWVEQGRSTLVFTNTRWQTEAWYQAILKQRPDWAGLIALHHGSLDPEVRTWVEDGLRDGRLKCVVCTSSLDLGSTSRQWTKSCRSAAPRESRGCCSGPGAAGINRLALAPDVRPHECVGADRVFGGAQRDRPQGDRRARAPGRAARCPGATRSDIGAGGRLYAGEFLDEIRSARTYAHTAESDVDWVLDFVTRGGSALRAYPEYRRVDLVHGTYLVSDPEIARRQRMSLGTIVSDTQMVVQYMSGGRLGTVEESFLARLNRGYVRVRRARAATGSHPRHARVRPQSPQGRRPHSPVGGRPHAAVVRVGRRVAPPS